MTGGGRGLGGALLIAAIWFGAAPAAPVIAGAPPQRIASLHLCTDQLTIMLAPRDHIVSVSYVAANPDVSAVAPLTKGLHLNHGRAEEILPLRPDLVVTGPYGGADRPLARIGIPVLRLDEARDLDSIRRNIRVLAARIGQQEKGASMIAAFDRRLAARSNAPRESPRADQQQTAPTGPRPHQRQRQRPSAVILRANFYSWGAGTLADEALRVAGFSNLAAEWGLADSGTLALESVIARAPDALILARAGGHASLASDLLNHPALRRLGAGRPSLTLATGHFVCGTPAIADAIATLAQLRRGLK